MKTDDYNYRIALLVARMSMGTITKEEDEELQRWSRLSGNNKALCDRWLRGEGLQEDFRIYSGFDTARAQRDLERKIAERGGYIRKPRRKPILRIAALTASVAVLLIGIYMGVGLFGGTDGHDMGGDRIISLISSEDPVLYFDGQAVSLKDATVVTGAGELTVVAADGTERRLTSDTRGAGQEVSIVVPKGRVFDLTLEDGSSIYLNAASSLHYPLNFEKDLREVRLSGEGFFVVSGDRARPFRVVTDNQTVEVVGTEFNVNAYPENGFTATTVFEGSVKASHADNGEILTPGMQAVSGIDKWMVQSVKTANVAAWRDGVFNLDGKTLETVMEELARWYDFSVEYENEEVKGIMFRGTMPRYDSFDKILEPMRKTEEIDFEIQGTTVRVKGRESHI